MDTPNTLNLVQAAAFLHVHEQTLLKLARIGEVPAAKVGRAWVFHHSPLTMPLLYREAWQPKLFPGWVDCTTVTAAQLNKFPCS